MVEVFALDPDARPAGVLGEPRHLGDRARPAGVVPLQRGELLDERRVDAHGAVGLGQLVEGGDQRLGHEPATEDPEVPGGVGPARLRRLESLLGRVDGARGHGPSVPRPGGEVVGWVGNTLVDGQPAGPSGALRDALAVVLPLLRWCGTAGAEAGTVLDHLIGRVADDPAVAFMTGFGAARFGALALLLVPPIPHWQTK